MCGIAGLAGAGPVDAALVRRLVDAQTSRGPDGRSVRALSASVVFGHARLAVRDLTPTGEQPMSDMSGRWTVTYNGELYGLSGLRKALVDRGVAFRGHSDTEVFVNAVAVFGWDALDRVDGMFAAAFHDAADGSVTLVRDRLGEKPLFFTTTPRFTAFASDVRALVSLSDAGVDARISPGGVSQFLAQGYVTEPDTVYAAVRAVEPATFVRFVDGRPTPSRRYWDLRAAFAARGPSDLREAADALESLLRTSVQDRLVAEVPLGAYLSSGVDSATVCAFAAEAKPGLATYTASFADPRFDEWDGAAAVAGALGVTAHRVEMRLDTASVAQAMDAVSDALADTSLVATRQLAETARRSLTVVLTGDGADELFGGYATYAADRLRAVLGPVPAMARGVLARGLRRIPSDGGRLGWRTKLHRFGLGLHRDPGAAHVAWRELFGLEERGRLLDLAPSELEAWDPSVRARLLWDEAKGLDLLSRAQFVDLRTWLPAAVLVKQDRTSMSVGLETRAPYLARAVVEFAVSLPAGLRRRWGADKRVLRAVAARVLPKGPARRSKAPFQVPLSGALAFEAGDAHRSFALTFAVRRGWVDPGRVGAVGARPLLST